MLARKLAIVYAEYQKRTPDQKHLQPGGEVPDQVTQTCHRSVRVHAKGASNHSYRIAPPMQPHYDDYDDDGDDLEHEKELGLSKTTVIFTRYNCKKCNPAEEHSPTATLPTPTELWWQNYSKVPDGCPLCHKVLFLRGNSSSPH